MKVIDIFTKELIADYPGTPGGVFFARRDWWAQYVKDITKWGNEQEMKIFYHKAA